MSRAEFDPNDPLAPLRGSASTADDRFVDQLDARLRVQHAAARRPIRPPLWRRLAVLAPTMLVLLVVASVVFMVRDQNPSAALVLTGADNVTVHLPDGTSVDNPADGFALIEGATLEIHDGGTATIDDVTVDVPAVLVVRDGALVSDVVATTTTENRSSDCCTEADVADEAALAEERDTIVDTPRATDELRVDAEPSVSPIRADEIAVEDPSIESPPEEGPALEIGMRLRSVDRGVHISWLVQGADDSWLVAIVRRDGDGAGEDLSTISELLSLDGVSLVTESRPAAEGHVVDHAPAGDRPARYRVVVVDSGGGIVASSPAQSLRP